MDYMRAKGLAILRNGYSVIPVIAGEKRPAIEGWRTIQATEALVNSWSGGIGIRTGYALFLDCDVPNAVVDRVRSLSLQHLGPAPVRIGNPPKLGLLYRTDRIYRTHLSVVFRDHDEQRCALEGLADGRQFVAENDHPVTGKPYFWVSGVGPHNTPLADLTLVTEAQLLAFLRLFEQLAEEEGWTRIGGSPATGLIDADGVPLAVKREPVGLEEDEIRRVVMSIANDDRFAAREDWFKVGAAIHHETGGSEVGRDIWHEWSTGHHTHDEALFRKAWDSMGVRYADPKYNPITFRFIQGIVKKQRAEELRGELDAIHSSIDLAVDLDALTAAAAQLAKLADVEPVRREAFAQHIKEVAARLGSPLPIGTIRDMLKPRTVEAGTPGWLRQWVFLQETAQFYNTETGSYLDRAAFDLSFNRHVEEIPPSRFATQYAKIPIAYHTAYMPSEGPLFTNHAGQRFVNTYREFAPATPVRYSLAELEDIEVVKNHATHLFGEGAERDIAILHSALAYIVQTKKRINWMLLIQGAEQIGKTFYAQMLRAVLGKGEHVHELSTDTLTESIYTSWAEGHLVVYVEELMLHGKRYDVLNRMKPYIANPEISIHNKYRKPHNTTNTTSYFAFTNFRDALPLDGGDTRFFILLSQWQNGDDVRQFKKGNPQYYPRLWRTLDRSAGALRRWLLEYELHPEFDPANRAPPSQGRNTMIEEAKPDVQRQVEDLLDEGSTPGVSRDLCVMHLLRAALADESGLLPAPEAIRSVLKRLQFTPVAGGRVRVTDAAAGIREFWFCWSQNRDVLRSTTGELRERIAEIRGKSR